MTKPKKPVRRYLKEVPRDENHPMYSDLRMYEMTSVPGAHQYDLNAIRYRVLSRRTVERINREMDSKASWQRTIPSAPYPG